MLGVWGCVCLILITTDGSPVLPVTTLNFDIHRLDLELQGRKPFAKTSINADKLSDSQLLSVCNQILVSNYHQFQRCMHSLSYSAKIRLTSSIYTRHKSLVDTIGTFNSTFQEDATLFFLTYAIKEIKQQNRRMCIIGTFSWWVSDLILSINPHLQLWYFDVTDGNASWNQYQLFRKHLYPHNIITMITGMHYMDFFLNQRELDEDGFCDVLYIRDASITTTSDVLHVAKIALRKSKQVSNDVSVIWNRYILPTHFFQPNEREKSMMYKQYKMYHGQPQHEQFPLQGRHR